MAGSQELTVAYFSMEICLEQSIPTYSGGLGVLAGDTIRSAADLGIPMVAVTLAHRKGYFQQHLGPDGTQVEAPEEWYPEARLTAADATVTVEIEGREVRVRAWRYVVRGATEHEVPVFLLDTALPENDERDRHLTDTLYAGDSRWRLAQEIVLGLGGAALLHALGVESRVQFHANEGHAALLTLALLERRLGTRPPETTAVGDIEAIARCCIFTTHTPVPAGHDRFPAELVRDVLAPRYVAMLDAAHLWDGGTLNMTRLALRCARFINGVALRHRDVSRAMFPEFPIGAITNGVHAVTWTSPRMQALLDREIPEWRRDNAYLRYASALPLDALRAAHALAKRDLLDEVARRTGVRLDPAALTIGFARRATQYKRADLIFSDLDRLRALVQSSGPLQLVFGGKAHPNDLAGKELIRRVVAAAGALDGAIRVVFLENYEMDLGRLLTSGSDVWLNNPTRPLEASGTSGMKAALNGVPSLSVLDGWWIEGCIDGVTGWAIGTDSTESDDADDAASLYDRLEHDVLPLYYDAPERFGAIMRNAIALNGSFFNTQRMVLQYLRNAYAPEGAVVRSLAAAR